MKTLITAAAALFAINVSAADIYYGLGDGNSDLSTQRLGAKDFAGVHPSIGHMVSPYHGWDAGNADLYRVHYSGPADMSTAPDIYMNVSGNPDLLF